MKRHKIITPVNSWPYQKHKIKLWRFGTISKFRLELKSEYSPNSRRDRVLHLLWPESVKTEKIIDKVPRSVQFLPLSLTRKESYLLTVVGGQDSIAGKQAGFPGSSCRPAGSHNGELGSEILVLVIRFVDP
jgi:hypothetical protein